MKWIVLELLKFVYLHIKLIGLDYDDKQVRELGRLVMCLGSQLKKK